MFFQRNGLLEADGAFSSFLLVRAACAVVARVRIVCNHTVWLSFLAAVAELSSVVALKQQKFLPLFRPHEALHAPRDLLHEPWSTPALLSSRSTPFTADHVDRAVTVRFGGCFRIRGGLPR